MGYTVSQDICGQLDLDDFRPGAEGPLRAIMSSDVLLKLATPNSCSV